LLCQLGERGQSGVAMHAEPPGKLSATGKRLTGAQSPAANVLRDALRNSLEQRPWRASLSQDREVIGARHLVCPLSTNWTFWIGQSKSYCMNMRRPEFRMSAAQARSFLVEAEVIHLAMTRGDGAPVLRTLNAAVSEDWLLFHAAPSGEKAACIGRPVVAQAEQIVATIPSYFSDPERACPATTYFRSVQVHGTLERIDDPHLKADALQRIMLRYQPEGGYVPISFHTPLYQNAIRGVLVLGIRLRHLTGKAKLGQNRAPEQVQQLIEGLWRRGAPGDARAIELMFRYHERGARPARFIGPSGTWLSPALGPDDLEAAVDLLEHQYWNRGAAREQIARAQLGSSAWLGARDDTGRLVATARANSDRARHAYIADVAVATQLRGQGVGTALLKLLLDHPQLRRTTSVRLATADASAFYQRFGFESEDLAAGAEPLARLLLRRMAMPDS
jgi:nitroimidazol reductase NimA-like FMN-containing flavoprotein (pyridoxamine 5'-phosphate oxidase superfamily)/predicted N-acetyltransferase YhbS